MQTLPAVRGLNDQLRLFETRRRPRQAAVDVYAVSRPASAFTGDFFFTHRYEDRLWFALGDVAGKGLNAAVVMAMIQEELEHRISACAVTRCDPAATMLRLHTFLRPLLPINKFATVVIGHLRDDGTLVVTNAGHCPPLLVRRSGMIEEIASTGPVTGILPSPQWTSLTTTLDRGEALILYSDGVSEAPAGEDRELGTSGIREAVSGRNLGSAREIARTILDVVHEQRDDLTLLVLRR
jgi:sigma-B regulation protein RsbU (phosphoserine phosphatase)